MNKKIIEFKLWLLHKTNNIWSHQYRVFSAKANRAAAKSREIENMIETLEADLYREGL